MRLAASAFIGFTHLPLQLAIYIGLVLAALTFVPVIIFLLQHLRLTQGGIFLAPDSSFNLAFLYMSFGASAIDFTQPSALKVLALELGA